MIGMTGFASVRVSEGALTVDVKIKAYNNRYFDLKLMLPSELEEKEWEIRRLLSQKISRGRVEAAFLLTKEGEVLPPVLNEEQQAADADCEHRPEDGAAGAEQHARLDTGLDVGKIEMTCGHGAPCPCTTICRGEAVPPAGIARRPERPGRVATPGPEMIGTQDLAHAPLLQV